MSVAPAFNEPILRHMGLPAAGDRALDGRGISIGIADWGFDLLHPCLAEEKDCRSRFDWIWDQNGSAAAARDAMDGDTINALLDQARRNGTRAAIDAVLDPHANYCWHEVPPEGAHGTLMASIAAGTMHGGFRGVAPGAALLGVQLALCDPQWKEVDETGAPTWRHWSPAAEPIWKDWRNYDEAPQIVSAVEALYECARERNSAGLVINLSLGAAAGAHDGCSPVERCITNVIEHGDSSGGLPTVVVLAAGNAGADEGHFAGEARSQEPATFTWRMATADPTPNKLEIWYSGCAPLQAELLLGADADDERPPLASFDIGVGPTVPVVLGGRLAGIADHVLNVRNSLSRVRIILHPPYFPRALPRDACGDVVFTLRLTALAEGRVHVNAWLERDDGLAERSCLSPCHPAGTLGSIAMAEGAIAVAGFDHRAGPTASSLFALSSLGPPPWQGKSATAAPHIAAPGLGIWGARSKSSGFSRTSGTSPAAALVSGACALLMQAEAAAGRRVRSGQIRDRLMALARPLDADGAGAWSPRYGWGAVNVQHLLGEGLS